MLVIGDPKQLLNGQISLPFYHRGHISLKNGTELSVCLIPRKNKDNKYDMTEIIMSPIPYDNWSNAWRLNIDFEDKPGVVSVLLNLLKLYCIDIIYIETLTINSKKIHRVELFIDVSNFVYYDKNNESNDIPELRKIICAVCVEYLHVKNGSFSVKLRKISGLNSSFDDLEKSKQLMNVVDYPLKRNCFVYNKSVSLPFGFCDNICKIFGVNHIDNIGYICTSDTKDKIVRVYLFENRQDLFCARIYYVGDNHTIATITAELSKNFDIVGSYNSNISRIDKYYDVILQTKAKTFSGINNKWIKDLLIDTLSGANLKNYNISIQFKIATTNNRKVKTIHVNKYKRKTISEQNLGIIDNFDTIGSLNNHYVYTGQVSAECKLNINRQHEADDLLTLAQDQIGKKMQNNNTDYALRYDAIRMLLIESGIKPKNKMVFVSYKRTNKSVIDNIKNIYSNYEVSTGYHLVTGKSLKEQIIDRIKKCHYMISVWHKKDRNTFWLKWEIGVAQALNKRVCILYEDGINGKFGLFDIFGHVSHNPFINNSVDDFCRAVQKIKDDNELYF